MISVLKKVSSPVFLQPMHSKCYGSDLISPILY